MEQLNLVDEIRSRFAPYMAKPVLEDLAVCTCQCGEALEADDMLWIDDEPFINAAHQAEYQQTRWEQ